MILTFKIWKSNQKLKKAKYFKFKNLSFENHSKLIIKFYNSKKLILFKFL